MTQEDKTYLDKVLYCYIKHYTHFHFFNQLFSRVTPELLPIYFTDNISLFLYVRLFRKAKIKLTPINFSKKKNSVVNLSDKTSKILQWEAAYMQKSKASVITKYQSLSNWYNKQMVENNLAFCWSGNNTESHAFIQTAKKLNHITYCGEITNYPQTVYLDHQGTNYFSELVNKIRASIDEDSIVSLETIENLKNLKLGQKHIPQASIKNKVQIFIVLYGLQQFIFSSGKRFSIWHVLIKKFQSLKARQQALIKKGEFIDIDKWVIAPSTTHKKIKLLIPLQVNHDTQLHVFSDFKSSFDYIKLLLSIIDDQTEVNIKLHPAEKQETNKLMKVLINKLHKKNANIRLISAFNFSDYDAIVTINSTFGIDALLSGCKVITFGQSLYSNFDFVLRYDQGEFNSIREAIEAYDKIVKPDSFKYFAKTIQDEFYNFNYFGDRIDQGISSEKLTKSIERLQQDIIFSMLAYHKK